MLKQPTCQHRLCRGACDEQTRARRLRGLWSSFVFVHISLLFIMHLIDICLLFWSVITQGFISVCWYLFAIYPAFNTDGYLNFVYLIVIDSAITEVREGASGPSARPVATAFFRRTNTSDVTWRRVPLSVWAACFDWRRHLVQTPRSAQPAAEGRNASRKRSRSVCSSYTASAPNRVPGGVSRRTIARAPRHGLWRGRTTITRMWRSGVLWGRARGCGEGPFPLQTMSLGEGGRFGRTNRSRNASRKRSRSV